MNTRLQVEHPVTEMVTGRGPREAADPDRAGRAAALPAGGPAPARPRHRVPGLCRGSRRRASCRAPGGSSPCGLPADRGCATTRECTRDTRCRSTTTRSSRSSWPTATDRRDAILRMRRAVSEYKILGIKTTLPFFAAGAAITRRSWPATSTPHSWRRDSRKPTASVSGRWTVAVAAAALARLPRPATGPPRRGIERLQAFGLVGGRSARGPARANLACVRHQLLR